MRWRDFIATLSDEDYRHLVIAIATGLREARLAAEAADKGDQVATVRYHTAAAIGRLTDALALMHLPEE